MVLRAFLKSIPEPITAFTMNLAEEFEKVETEEELSQFENRLNIALKNIEIEEHQVVKKGDYIKTKNSYTRIICKKFTPEEIQSLSALFDIGFFDLYSEAYERIIKEKAGRDVFSIIFNNLLDSKRILERIKIALKKLGQKTLLQAFEK